MGRGLRTDIVAPHILGRNDGLFGDPARLYAYRIYKRTAQPLLPQTKRRDTAYISALRGISARGGDSYDAACAYGALYIHRGAHGNASSGVFLFLTTATRIPIFLLSASIVSASLGTLGLQATL